MKKKRASEPELAQSRVQFLLDDDLSPVEKHFMAPSADEAFKMFAFSCREILPDGNINAEEEESKPVISEVVIEQVTAPRPDPLMAGGAGDAESPFAQVPLGTVSGINGDSAPAGNVPQPNPAIEYAKKRTERDAEIVRITAANAEPQEASVTEVIE